MVAIEVASDDDAFPTTVLVLVFTALVIPAVCVLVLLFTFAVPAAMAAAKEEEAVPTTLVVLAFTALVMPEVCALVLALMTAASEDEAVVTSFWSASEPDDRVAPVRVRVALVHTVSASVPNEVSVRPL